MTGYGESGFGEPPQAAEPSKPKTRNARELVNLLRSGAPLTEQDRHEIAVTLDWLASAAGAVTQGPSFTEIAKDLPRRAGEKA